MKICLNNISLIELLLDTQTYYLAIETYCSIFIWYTNICIWRYWHYFDSKSIYGQSKACHRSCLDIGFLYVNITVARTPSPQPRNPLCSTRFVDRPPCVIQILKQRFLITLRHRKFLGSKLLFLPEMRKGQKHTTITTLDMYLWVCAVRCE